MEQPLLSFQHLREIILALVLQKHSLIALSLCLLSTLVEIVLLLYFFFLRKGCVKDFYRASFAF